MRKTSLFAVSVLALAAFSLPVFAQPAPTTQAQELRQPWRQMNGGILGVLSELDLSEEQKQKVRTLQEDAQAKMQAARDLPAEERREQMQTTMRETQAQLQEILTPEQQTKARELMASRRGMQGGPLGRIQQAIQQLDLTPEQREKARALAEEYRPKFQELREAVAGDRATTAEKSRALLQEFTGKLNELLTPEQKHKLQEQLSQERQGEGDRPQRGERRRGETNQAAPEDAPAGDAQ